MATSIEYGLIAAVVAATTIGVVSYITNNASPDLTPIVVEQKANPGQEGEISFKDPQSPILFKATDDSYFVACPQGQVMTPVGPLDDYSMAACVGTSSVASASQ